MKLGEKLTILDRTIQFSPNKYFVPLEKMNESKAELSEMVRTDDLEIKTPAFQHGSLSWLTVVEEVITIIKNDLLYIKLAYNRKLAICLNYFGSFAGCWNIFIHPRPVIQFC